MAGVHGAARNSRVIRQLREELAADHGLPMGEYRAELFPVYDHDSELLVSVTFTRESNGATIEIGEIYTAADGEVTQHLRAVLG